MVRYDAVLVPTDGSESIASVLDHAIPLAKANDATVHGLYVADRRIALAATDENRETVRDALSERGRDALATVESACEDAGVDVTTATREGVPDREILAYVADEDVDVVVMGTHGRTGRDRIAHLGSVAERVVTDAAVPVFVVPVPGGEGGDGGDGAT
jgi:nucleotide-binding universal stress UspA family protein